MTFDGRLNNKDEKNLMRITKLKPTFPRSYPIKFKKIYYNYYELLMENFK